MYFATEEFRKWVIPTRPRCPQKGEFREKHIYPKTGEEFVLIFSCEHNFNGYCCSVIGVEEKF